MVVRSNPSHIFPSRLSGPSGIGSALQNQPGFANRRRKNNAPRKAPPHISF
nr:MAG TPA: hypothetical protein [Caudoviricetes sp.]